MQMCFRFIILNFCLTQWSVRAQIANMYLNLMAGNRNSCPMNTTCIPMASCTFLDGLLDTSCLSSDKYFQRLNELSCGNFNNEDYVCCPSCESSSSSSLSSCQCDKQISSAVGRCGTTMLRSNQQGIGAHPWLARIGFTHLESGAVRFACSGSIISKRGVLTAAHCALYVHEGYKLSTVVIGEYDISRNPDCNEYFCGRMTQAIPVEQVIVHPGYEKQIMRHDIAIVVLKKEMEYSLTSVPICLHENPEEMGSARALLVGWGLLSGQNRLVSEQQQLEVPIVPLTVCERIYGPDVPLNEGQLCAGGEGGRDACSGFGGSPLLVRRDGRFVQIGIVLFGSKNCSKEGTPSVYTKVAHYFRWITENLPASS